jgi:hypothetical protein
LVIRFTLGLSGSVAANMTNAVSKVCGFYTVGSETPCT